MNIYDTIITFGLLNIIIIPIITGYVLNKRMKKKKYTLNRFKKSIITLELIAFINVYIMYALCVFVLVLNPVTVNSEDANITKIATYEIDEIQYDENGELKKVEFDNIEIVKFDTQYVEIEYVNDEKSTIDLYEIKIDSIYFERLKNYLFQLKINQSLR